MAITLVLKAKAETQLAQQTARFEITKPTAPQIGLEDNSGPELLQADIYRTLSIPTHKAAKLG